jgi:hypothetical protein
MTWREAISAAIRTFILNSLIGDVVADLAAGLTPADEALVDAYLDTLMP